MQTPIPNCVIAETEDHGKMEGGDLSISYKLEKQQSSLPPLIFVSEDSVEREKIVFEILRGMSLKAQCLSARFARRIQSAISIVGLCGVTEEDSKLRLILELRRAGQSIVAYAHGANDWEISAKCRPILAGANVLLDSSSLNFKAEFVSALTKAINAQETAKLTRDRLFGAMTEHGIVGKSIAITEAFQSAVRYSEISDLPVLVTGESGTGKELIARAVARMDPFHKNGAFVAVNCASVPSNIIESEVFGHRRGSFTGADRERKGWIKAADGGVLFLDEIGEMELGFQAKLLRVLQDGRVRSLGEDHDVAVKTRFVAATNRNLEHSVENGTFRNDLLNRLHVLTLRMPGLHERLGDIRPLVEHFVEKHHAIPEQTIRTISEDYIAALEQLKMPGNVRQLENVVCRSLVGQRHAGKLSLDDLPVDALSKLTRCSKYANSDEELGPEFQVHEFVKYILKLHGWNLQITLRECEKFVCSEALKLAHGNQSEAARLLGVTSRCIYNKVHKSRA